jgi:polyamine oxidase
MSTVSGWFFDSDSNFGASDDGNDAVFPHGYDAMLDALRAGLDIRLGKAVTQISEDGSEHGCNGTNAMAVVAADGSAVCCQKAVVTVPLGVLKAGSIAFSPALPSDKARRIAALGFVTTFRTV